MRIYIYLRKFELDILRVNNIILIIIYYNDINMNVGFFKELVVLYFNFLNGYKVSVMFVL